jgi:hypothetical protein
MADQYARKGDRPPWSWQGAAALVIAVSIGGGWLAGIILAALAAGKGGLDPELSQLLNGIGQVLAGALGTYLGFSVGLRAPDPTTSTPETTPPVSPSPPDAAPPGPTGPPDTGGVQTYKM